MYLKQRLQINPEHACRRLHPSSLSVDGVLTDLILISDMPPSQSNKYRTSMPPGVLSSVVVVSTHKMFVSLIDFNSIDGWHLSFLLPFACFQSKIRVIS
jgi:hypothetical protein